MALLGSGGRVSVPVVVGRATGAMPVSLVKQHSTEVLQGGVYGGDGFGNLVGKPIESISGSMM